MKAYLGIKFYGDYSNREVIEDISSALEQSGFQAVCMVRDVEQWGRIRFEPQALMEKTFEEIGSSDIVVIDLTEKGVGLGIEAGYAYAKDIPIVTVAKSGSDISDTLKGISQGIFLYEKPDELPAFFKRHLKCKEKK